MRVARSPTLICITPSSQPLITCREGTGVVSFGALKGQRTMVWHGSRIYIATVFVAGAHCLHLADADLELERLPAVAGGVKLGAVGEGTCVERAGRRG